MAVKTFSLDEDKKLTPEQEKMVERAAGMPSIYDEDNPELTAKQLADFRRVHELTQMDRRRQNVTLRLSPQAIKKAKALGKGYSGILSRIIEATLEDPAALQRFL